MKRFLATAAAAFGVAIAAGAAGSVPADATPTSRPAPAAPPTVLVRKLARAAQAQVREPASVALGVALPIYRVRSLTWRPPGFTTDAAEAIAACEHNRRMLAIHAREHPLGIIARIWLGRYWLIDFTYHGHLVAEVTVSKAGKVSGVWTGPLAIAPYARGKFARPFGRWWVLLPFSLLFLVVFIDPRRPLRAIHLDALAVLAFLVSYLLFDHAHLIAAVWSAYPPLVYLLARLLWIGFGARRRPAPSGGGRPGRRAAREHGRTPAALLPLPVLAVGLIVLVAARTALSLTDATVVDVGYASVIGAHQIAVGAPIYFHSAAHGDTYGPVTYLAYLPFELLFPWHGAWNYLPSAHAASLCFDLVTVAALVALGPRLAFGRAGVRLGLALGWAWAACPFTLLALMMHTNDGLVAMLSVLGLLAFSSPAARGALLGLGAAAKFFPAALLGLYAVDRRHGLRGTLACAGAFAAVVVVAIVAYLPPGGLSEFYNQTIGFQLQRTDVFSPWALYGSLAGLKVAIEVAVIALCALVAFLPRRRTPVQVAALAGAITIAVQLPAIHWFYYYIVWFIPFLAVALLAGDVARAPAADRLRHDAPGLPAGERTVALVA